MEKTTSTIKDARKRKAAKLRLEKMFLKHGHTQELSPSPRPLQSVVTEGSKEKKKPQGGTVASGTNNFFGPGGGGYLPTKMRTFLD